MKISSFTKELINKLLNKRHNYLSYLFYSSQFKQYLKQQGFENKKINGEEDYIKKWSALCPRVEPYSYRFFSHFCGLSPNIIPEDIGHSYVEQILNPIEYRYAYSDKNLMPEIIGKDFTPRTVVCRINGGNLLDSNYKYADKELTDYIGDLSSLILKPTVDTDSGRGIIKFVKIDGVFVSVNDNTVLTKEYLLSYQNDFCLQESVTQHSFMSQLCSSSVNTIRMCLYRSVKDESPIVTASVIRIGKEGSYVDNAHAGGMIIGVDVLSGQLGKFVVDQFGNKQNNWNGIVFSNQSLFVPNWENVISFAKYIGTRIHHHRLVALDIALNENAKPIIIEYNVKDFGFWVFMLVNQEVFGKYTDEIINYCKVNK